MLSLTSDVSLGECLWPAEQVTGLDARQYKCGARMPIWSLPSWLTEQILTRIMEGTWRFNTTEAGRTTCPVEGTGTFRRRR
jgi:hypothetical protein